MTVTDLRINEEKPLFRLFFLKDYEDQIVEIGEIKKIDLA